MTKLEFSRTMKEFRERQKFTQEAAADRLRVSLRTLQNWEIARNMPTGFGLRAILETLEAPATAQRSVRRAPKKRSGSSAPLTFPDSLETRLL